MGSNLNCRIDDKITILSMEGQFTGGEETDELLTISKNVIESENRYLIVDFTKTTFISSIVLGMFVKIHNEFTEAQGRMMFTGLNKVLENVFRMTKLGTLLDIEPTLDIALEKIRQD